MSDWISQQMVEAAAKAIKDGFRHPDMDTDGQCRRVAYHALQAALPMPPVKDAQQVIAAAQGAIIEGLQRERDALRKCVGDIEYYFRRWSGILPDERSWMESRLRKMGIEIADGGGTVQTEIDLLRQQLARWEMFRKAGNIPQTAVEAAIDDLAGYCDPPESLLAQAIASAIGVLCLHVPLQIALSDAIKAHADEP